MVIYFFNYNVLTDIGSPAWESDPKISNPLIRAFDGPYRRCAGVEPDCFGTREIEQILEKRIDIPTLSKLVFAWWNITVLRARVPGGPKGRACPLHGEIGRDTPAQRAARESFSKSGKRLAEEES